MSYTVSELLLRNLRDVFGENDPARRRAAINELYNEECVFYDPNKGAHRGRDAIDRIAGIIKATHPDYQYQPIGAPEESGDAARCRWVSGTPGQGASLRRDRFRHCAERPDRRRLSILRWPWRCLTAQ